TMIKELNVLTKDLQVNSSIILKNGIEKTDFNRIDELLTNWTSNIKLIVDWTRYQRAYADCKQGGLDPYLNIIYSGDDILFDIIKKFKKSFLFNQFQDILNKYPVLKTFESLTQDNIVKKFKELDLFQLELAKIRVLTNLFNRKPDTSWDGSKSSQLGYLQRQFRLKRAHHSIRRIFGNVPNIVQQLCPCFMMSPLSLSQYINPEEMKFDYVIFDEASQMSPVDSLGAIIRGEYLVCVGDTKQLPPTTFFDTAEQIEYDDENFSIMDTQDLESILDECLTIGMKEYLLNWHYRSRHESLIHFSNKSFYGNRLNTFPSPDRDNMENGLSLIQVENGIYDRGGNQRNIKEAKMVAKAVFNHYKNNASKSLGVGTFSQSQQTAILDELEILRRNDSSLEYFFSSDKEESLFVKNLETIQGDERDVIFILVGYGRDSSGKITMNFGPLNKVGGERRLNVLITRAREKVIVFSSITGNDFDLSKTQALGVHNLKQYLDFAQSYRDKSSIEPIDDLSGNFDESNIFEKSVYDQLLSMGIKAIPQVGYSGYKIDFGILHPKYPSKFILAVECDGASYHSSNTARDRDRIRQQVLENLGWRFYRIWSTDWFLNPHREIKKLQEAIEDAKKTPLNLGYNNTTTDIEIEPIETTTNTNNLGIEIIPYELFTVEPIASQEYFYKHSYSEKWRIIFDVVNIESPIHIKELSLRVIQHFMMSKVGAKIQLILNSVVEQMSKLDKLIYKDNFVYK
ncbi:MAG: AAA domain-containing protein, partial [Nitrosopumilus sp.]